MYAKTCSQPKAAPATKRKPPNQADTRKPRADTQKSPCTQDNANQPKQSHVHTTTPKDPHADTVPPTHHPMVDTRSTRASAPPPPRQHTITVLSTQQPSPRALKKIPMCRHKNKRALAQISPAPTSKQQMEDTTPTQKIPGKRHADTAPLQLAHTIPCTQDPRKPAPRAPFQPRKPPLSREHVQSFIG